MPRVDRIGRPRDSCRHRLTQRKQNRAPDPSGSLSTDPLLASQGQWLCEENTWIGKIREVGCIDTFFSHDTIVPDIRGSSTRDIPRPGGAMHMSEDFQSCQSGGPRARRCVRSRIPGVAQQHDLCLRDPNAIGDAASISETMMPPGRSARTIVCPTGVYRGHEFGWEIRGAQPLLTTTGLSGGTIAKE